MQTQAAARALPWVLLAVTITVNIVFYGLIIAKVLERTSA